MRLKRRHADLVLLVLLAALLVGLPLGIVSYDRHLWQHEIPSGAKVFTLTGHTRIGWVTGEIRAYDIVALSRSEAVPAKPVLKVRYGDQVVLKIKSSDVVHGFSLKDFGIFITEGIQPGKVTLVSFTADKTGTFTFSCNAICGENHEHMQGSLIVLA